MKSWLEKVEQGEEEWKFVDVDNYWKVAQL